MRIRTAFAVVPAILSGAVLGCGTILNLAGYEERRPAQAGPDKGHVEWIPQAAVFGGIRTDIIMGYAAKLGPNWPFPSDHSYNDGSMVHCACGWWPSPPTCCMLLDLPLSCVLDLLLLPLTALITDPDPEYWWTDVEGSPSSRRRR